MHPIKTGSRTHDMEQQNNNRVMIWDAPVRLFHWALAICIVVSVASGMTGGNAMQIHLWSGYTILALVLFRLLWGFVGSTYARFADFLYGPRAVWSFARMLFGRDPAQSVHYAGHNPLGGWMVVALLVLLLLQASTGLFSSDDIVTEGPLARLVSKVTSDRLTALHDLNSTIIIVLVVTHIVAVLFHLLVKRENLIVAMISGYKNFPAKIPFKSAHFRSSWLASVLFAVAVAGVYFLVQKPT